MITPPYLKIGSKVAIAAPARKVSLEELTENIVFLQKIGFEVYYTQELFLIQNQLAGSDHQRATYFQSLIDNPEIEAIFCARGGYGTSRMVDFLNYDKLKQHPKWIIGFSDITVLLNDLYVNGLCSLHGPMPLWFLREGATKPNQLLFDFLFGKVSNKIQIDSHLLNINGEAKGKLVGGNLSVFTHLLGSKSFPNTDGCILFLEDLDEYLYHIDRMMLQLKRAGILQNLAGLVVGHFTEMKDNTIPWGKSAYEIISEHVSDYSFPVIFNFPAGHLVGNYPLIIGQEYHLVVNNDFIKFEINN